RSIGANPLLFALLDLWQARRDAEAAAAAAAQAVPEDVPPGPPLPEGDHIVLVGFGRVGSLVGRRLHETGKPIALIESNRDYLDQAREAGIAGILGNAAAEEVLAEVRIADARALLVAIPQTLEAGQIIRRARAANPAIAVLARAHSDEDVAYLLNAGADAAIMGEREIARSMCESIGGLERWFERRAALAAEADGAGAAA